VLRGYWAAVRSGGHSLAPATLLVMGVSTSSGWEQNSTRHSTMSDGGEYEQWAVPCGGM
jgi:hypothetical protein